MSATNVYNLHRALLGLYDLTTSFQNVKIKLLDIQKIESKIIATKLKEENAGKHIILLHNKMIKNEFFCFSLLLLFNKFIKTFLIYRCCNI